MQQKQQQHGDELVSSSIDYFDLREAVWDAEVGSTATLVGMRLVDNWPRIWPSLDFISRKTKLSERAVRYALRELEGAGVISIESRGHNKTRRYWFLDERGERIIIPRVGRRKPKGDGGGEAPPTAAPKAAPTVDPDDFEPESGTQRHQVPPTAVGSGGHHMPRGVGAPRAPRGAAGAPQVGAPRAPEQVTSSNKQTKGGNARAAKRASGRQRPSAPPLFTSFEGWTMSAELRAELIAMGVNGAKIDRRVRALRNRPGLLGKGVTSLDDYIRENAEARWVLWDAEDAVSSGALGARSAFPSPGRGSDGPTSGGAVRRVPGFPAWVYPEHADFARAAGLDLKQAAIAFGKQERISPSNRPPCDVFAPLMEFLKALARKQQSGAAKKAKAA